MVHLFFLATALRDYINQCKLIQIKLLYHDENSTTANIQKPTTDHQTQQDSKLLEKIAIKGRFGFTKLMQRYHNFFFNFYKFDMPIGMVMVLLGVYPVWFYDKIATVNIFIKSFMMFVMTIECLLSHMLAPKPSTTKSPPK